MSNIWISAKTAHVPGPQPNTVIETQKMTLAYSGFSLTYALHTNAQTAPTEPAKMQVAYTVVSLTYA